MNVIDSGIVWRLHNIYTLTLDFKSQHQRLPLTNSIQQYSDVQVDSPQRLVSYPGV